MTNDPRTKQQQSGTVQPGATPSAAREALLELHVRAVVHDRLRHRLILSYEAVSQGVNADQVIDKITELVVAA